MVHRTTRSENGTSSLSRHIHSDGDMILTRHVVLPSHQDTKIRRTFYIRLQFMYKLHLSKIELAGFNIGGSTNSIAPLTNGNGISGTWPGRSRFLWR